MSDRDYVPLTDEQVAEIRDHVVEWREYGGQPLYRWAPRGIEALIADREYYKRRVEAAERRSTGCPFNCLECKAVLAGDLMI